MMSRGKNKKKQLWMRKEEDKGVKYICAAEIFFTALLLVFIIAVMRGVTPIDVDLSVLEDDIDACIEQSGLSMAASDAMRIKRSYGLNTEDYEDILYYEPYTNMDVDEVFIVHVKDSSQIETVKEAMEQRIEDQKTSFDGYGTDQLEILGYAQVYSNDMYVCLVISSESRQIMSLIRSRLEESI